MANTPFKKDFDTLLDEELTDYENEFETIDRSEGSAVFNIAAASSAARWGLYEELDKIAKKIFPDECDDVSLEHHGEIRGLPRIDGEELSTYRQRVLDRLRNPPAGCNAEDWESWARSVSYDHTSYIESVNEYYCYENDRGAGSINIVVTSNRTAAQGGEEEATTELVAAITDKIEDERPVGIWDFLVIAATKKTQNIVMDVTGGCDAEKTETDIIAFMKNLAAGAKLYRQQLEAIAIANGADTASVATPSADVDVSEGPYTYERIWPGTVTINT